MLIAMAGLITLITMLASEILERRSTGARRS